MLNQFSRTELAIGPEGIDVLKGSTVVVLGLGGVGSIAAESLARAGVGKLILIDKDVVDVTNINRQIQAFHHTIGQSKALLMEERVKQVNPDVDAVVLEMFYTEETYERLFEHHIDYVVDASDTVTYKIHIIKECLNRKIPIISSMGAANRMDPTKFKVADISQTEMDPLARVIRQKLRKDGIRKGVKVIYSTEEPIKPRGDVTKQIVPENAPDRRKAQQPPASNSFVPPVAGLIMVSVVVKDLLEIAEKKKQG